LCWPEVLRPSGKRDLGAVGTVVVVVVVAILVFLSRLDLFWLTESGWFRLQRADHSKTRIVYSVVRFDERRVVCM